MNIPATRTIAILCSGFGLGFYIPGLLIGESLRRLGLATSVEVFESLLTDAKIAMVEKNRQAYHESFRVALTSQKVPVDSRGSLEPNALRRQLEHWREMDCRHFICLSGHWVPVLDAYRRLKPEASIQADLLYVDADLSPSWKWLRKLQPDYATGYREIRLYDRARLDINFSIEAGLGEPIPYESRQKRLVVHGGGWGMGTFQERIPELEAAGFSLDIVCYNKTGVGAASANRRYFMDDPTWRTWQRSENGEHTFPPFGEVTASSSSDFTRQPQCHGLYRVIRQSLGIVSKPGAGTLIDSFASATPLIMLEPFGPHEECNAQVWTALQFGVPYQRWADAGYPESMLGDLHRNLLVRRAQAQDYAQSYAESLFGIH